MGTSHSDCGASRLFHTIIVVGALGSTACGGTVTEVSPDGERASGGTLGAGGTTTGGNASNTGGVPQNTGGSIVFPSGGNTGTGGDSNKSCFELDDWVCSDETQTYCTCDPSQPDGQADCAAGTYFLGSYPLRRLCLPEASGPEACDSPAQYSQIWVGDNGEISAFVCDPYAPLTEADCTEGHLSCQSYDPPTSCHCYVGILK